MMKVNFEQYTVRVPKWETSAGKGCIWHSVVEYNGKYCKTESMKWMSQLGLCVHGCTLKVQQWSSTPNGIRSRSLHSEVQSALYKVPCQWNSLGQLHVFYFFPRAVSYSQIIYKWVGGMSASQDVPVTRRAWASQKHANRHTSSGTASVFSSEVGYGECYYVESHHQSCKFSPRAGPLCQFWVWNATALEEIMGRKRCFHPSSHIFAHPCVQQAFSRMDKPYLNNLSRYCRDEWVKDETQLKEQLNIMTLT